MFVCAYGSQRGRTVTSRVTNCWRVREKETAKEDIFGRGFAKSIETLRVTRTEEKTQSITADINSDASAHSRYSAAATHLYTL